LTSFTLFSLHDALPISALLLSSVGIYGVLSHLFARRTREIGVRMALGATRSQIASQVLGLGLRLTAIGIAVGLVCALAGTRLLADRKSTRLNSSHVSIS